MILANVDAENSGKWMEVLKGYLKMKQNNEDKWGKDKSRSNMFLLKFEVKTSIEFLKVNP